jgi:hypothetical protein
MIKIAKHVVAVFAVASLPMSVAHAAANNSADLLQYVPADTPYVLASTEPLSSALADKFEPTVDEVLQAYQRVVRYLMAEQIVKMSSEEGGAEAAEQFRGLMEEVLNLVSLDGIRGVGIERESAFVFYGNGLMPVLRLELSDAALFDAAIARFEEKAGKALLSGTARGATYQYADADKMKLIITTLDDQAVFTIVPTNFDESQVALALGIKTPRKNLKKSKTLRSLNKEYGFSGYLTGYVDTERLAGMLTGKTTSQDDAFFAALGEEAPGDISDVCAAEIMEMAGIAPRIVFGYSDLSTQSVKSSMVVELRDDIAAGLATIPASVPGLGLDPGGFMSFGFGMNPMALRNFYEARLDAMEADPYECDTFAELQAGVAKGREALEAPLPPVVYSFRGMVANIADIQGLDFSKNSAPESIDASILIAVENAESLIMMAAMMDPQIAALNLVPDGKPVKLELTQLAEFAGDVFAALSTDALSISLGEAAADNAASMLVADSSDPAPFLSMNMDSARYYAMLGEAMSQETPGEGEEKMPKAIRDAISEVMVLSGSMYERMSVDVQFTSRGVEINSVMKLSD